MKRKWLQLHCLIRNQYPEKVPAETKNEKAGYNRSYFKQWSYNNHKSLQH
jgi:hypothetical protein